jgi:hypothetical protein
MMHQRNESMGCAQCLGGIRQRAEGKAVDHDRRADRQRCQGAPAAARVSVAEMEIRRRD